MTIFKAYDIRGVVGQDLTIEKAYLIGFYLPEFLKVTELKVAHDLRESQELLTKCFIQGALDAQAKIIYLGESSTPNFYYSLFQLGGTGVQITASHNPKEYNGFKIMHGLDFLDAKTGLVEFGKIVEADPKQRKGHFEFISKKLSKISFSRYLKKSNIEKQSQKKAYIEYLKDLYKKILTKPERAQAKELKIGLDFSSGVSSLAMVPLLKKLKLSTVLYNHEPNGAFPTHSPDPNKAGEFLIRQSEVVDSIVVFDGDGDRMMVYDETKKVIPQDLVIAKFMDSLSSVEHHFCCDLTVSRCVEKLGEQKGFTVQRLAVGRSKFTPYMKEKDVAFGGELSGHIFFREFRYFDNPDIAFMYYLKFRVQERTTPASKMFEKYNFFVKNPIVNVEVENANKSLELLKQKFSSNIVSELDGISFDFGEYWFNVRKSNTEPIVRITLEGKDKDIVAKQLVLIKSMLGGVDHH